MLDPTQKESDLLKSIKKHMVDNLTPLSIPIYFDLLTSAPVDSFGNPHTKWCCCTLGEHELGAVSTAQLTLVLFVKNDSEGGDLSSFSDDIIGCFVDPDSPNGVKLIVYYSTSVMPWVNVGGIVPFVGVPTDTYRGRDLTKFKTIPVTLKWGSK